MKGPVAPYIDHTLLKNLYARTADVDKLCHGAGPKNNGFAAVCDSPLRGETNSSGP